MSPQIGFSPLARALIVTAAICILVLFARSAAQVLAPALLALFIAIVATPPLRWLRGKGMPKYLAVVLILLVLMEIASLVALTTTSGLEALRDGLPRYQERLVLLSEELGRWLEAVGIDGSRAAVRDLISPVAVSRFIYAALTNASSTLGTGLLVLLIVAFMLVEASSLPAKLQAAFRLTDMQEARLKQLFTAVNQYMLIKCMTSLATGICIWIWLKILGIEYAVALAVAAVLFNFVPIVGNILMAVPAVLIALVQANVSTALLVALGYVVVNAALGNVVEPRLMGRELGVSSLVVLLSLLFWGWVLGPIGLFLSVPLTMALIVALEASPRTRPIAIMLGSETSRAEDSDVASDGKQVREKTGLGRDPSDTSR
ncbi:MAG TPA: AI-2E family transporter [Hyphomicrobiaceae bacterium]|nr:AI-2E family transporter [Hyphomicrobiaceae bacterium]